MIDQECLAGDPASYRTVYSINTAKDFPLSVSLQKRWKRNKSQNPFQGCSIPGHFPFPAIFIESGVFPFYFSFMKLFHLIAALATVSAAVFAQDYAEITPETKDGRLIYESWCARCHGMDGSGPVEGIELDTPVPDMRDCSFNTREPRRDWKAVILDGGPARGLSMTMPAWRTALTEEQADAIIDHIKTFCPEKSWVSGELNFRRAQITEKAFPENEALVIPTYQYGRSRTLTTKFLYEGRIGPEAQWEISLPLVTRPDPRANGIGDIEVAGKYAVHHDSESLSILSLGLEAGLPTGSESRGLGDGVWRVSPFLAAAKGYENLFFQTSIKLEKPLEAGAEAELFCNFAATAPMTDEKMGLFPTLELNIVKVLGSSASTVFLTPQLYIGVVKRGHIALSVGAQIPIAGEKPYDFRIVSFLLWEYADGGLWW